LIGSQTAASSAQILDGSLNRGIERSVRRTDSSGVAERLAQTQLAGGSVATTWQRDSLDTRDYALASGGERAEHACPMIHD